MRIELLEEARRIHAETNETSNAQESPIEAAREELWKVLHRLASVEQELAGIKSTFAYRAYVAVQRMFKQVVPNVRVKP